jgi:hypothetical protein
VSQRVPGNESKASRKIDKHLDGVKKIVAVYPDLVDSVSAPVKVAVQLNEDSLSSPDLSIDSLAVALALAARDKAIIALDSMNNLFWAGNLSREDSIRLHYELINIRRKLKIQTKLVIESIFKDTTISVTKVFPLFIGSDTLEISVTGTTVVLKGIPKTTFTLGAVDTQTIINHQYPMFTVYEKLPKLIRWVIVLAILATILGIAWLVIKKALL